MKLSKVIELYKMKSKKQIIDIEELEHLIEAINDFESMFSKNDEA